MVRVPDINPVGTTILLVEDEALIALNEAQELEKCGYVVRVVHSGIQAIEAAGERDITLILMDIDLGRGVMDGTSAAVAILQNRSLPIVFLSSHSEAEVVRRTEAIASFGYVTKGTPVTALDASIRMALRLFQAQRSLFEQSEVLGAQQLVEHASSIVAATDMGGRLTYVNAAFLQALGYSSAQEVIGLPFTQFWQVDERQEEIMHRLTAPGEPGTWDGEVALHGKNGFSRWVQVHARRVVDGSGAPVGLMSTSTDASQRRHIAAELKKSQERFRVIFDGAPDAMLLADRDSGVIVNANEAAARLFDTTVEQLIGAHQSELHPEAHHGSATTSFKNDPPAPGTPGPPVVIPIQSATGEEKIVEIRGTVITLDNRVHVLGHFRDITESYRREEQLQRLNRENELLIHEVNHRVKNSLRIVRSLIDLKDAEIGGDGALSDLAGQIDAIRIVHDHLARGSDARSIEMHGYLEELLTTVFSAVSGPSPILSTKVTAGKLPSKTASSLGIVINEIAINAMKYSFPQDPAPWFTVTLDKEQNEHYCLTVEHAGGPFPEEIDLDNPTTLGLRLVSALVSQLEGTVELRRSPNPGYTIQFP